MSTNKLLLEYIKISLAIIFYWLISISMVFLNKYVFSDKSFGLDAPLFITFFQCLSSIAITLLVSLLIKFKKDYISELIDFPELTINLLVLKKTFLLTFFFVSMIVSNNLCLKYVPVSFYFISRSLTTAFNVIFIHFFLNEKTSFNVILTCCVMIFGFCLGVDQENVSTSFNYIGILFGVLSSIFVSLNSIFSKKILSNVNNNVWLINLYNNINSAIFFLPLIIFSGEFSVLMKFENYSLNFFIILFLSGLFGFLIQISSVLQIKLTSPLTHNISGTVKSCLQTVIAVIYMNEHKPFLWWFSNFLVIIGSLIYLKLKQSDMKKNILNNQNLDDKKLLLTNVKTS